MCAKTAIFVGSTSEQYLVDLVPGLEGVAAGLRAGLGRAQGRAQGLRVGHKGSASRTVF